MSDLRPEINLAEVSKAYGRGRNAVPAVEYVNLDIRHNEFVSLLGPSGCGKSTLMLMIAGLVKPSSGTISIEGRKVEGPQRTNGIVFQDPVLLPWRTVLDNVLLPIELMGENVAAYRNHAFELLEIAEIADFTDRLPHELSGGMRQRAGICRALIQHPTLLLMDEPFSALDAMMRVELQDLLLQLWRELGLTILFVTHDLDEALYLAQRVLVLSASPGTVADVVDVPLPYPRNQVETRSQSVYLEMRERLYRLMVEQVMSGRVSAS